MTAQLRWTIPLLAAGIIGCARNIESPPLRSAAFTASSDKPTIPTDPTSSVDQGGALATEHPNPQGAAPGAGGGHGKPPETVNGGQHLSTVVQENVTAPGGAIDLSTTAPAVARVTTGPSSGEYVTLGGVLAEVNTTPIYADKVLSQIAPVLSARAKESSREQFRNIAAKEIRDQVQALVNLELEYAAALRNLDQKDKDFAEALTADWRRHKIAESEGSLELARKRAESQGQNFDDMLNEQYRLFMSQIYQGGDGAVPPDQDQRDPGGRSRGGEEEDRRHPAADCREGRGFCRDRLDDERSGAGA